MFSNEYLLKVDLKLKYSTTTPVFVQYDSAALLFMIFDNGKKFDLTGYTSVEVSHKRKDGTTIVGSGSVVQDDKGNDLVRYDYQGSEMNEIGFVETSVSILSNTDKISIQPFKVKIVTDLRDGYLETAKEDYGLLQELTADVQSLVTNANQAVADATEAKNNADTLIADTKHVGDYNVATAYKKNNTVAFNGSSYMAIQDTTGNAPPTEPTTSNAYWRLVGRKGADGTGTVVRHRDEFIATEGQTLFTLSNPYDQFQNRIDVEVGGVPQFSPDNFTEASSTTFILSEGITAGTKVIATYFSEAQPLGTDLETTVNSHTTTLNNNNNLLTQHGTKLDEHTSQLADMAVQPYSRNAESLTSTRVTIYVDDGNPKDYDRILPIANAEGIVLNAGVFYQDHLGAVRITDAQIQELQNVHGWEIDSHTYNHYGLTDLTEAEIDDQLRLNKIWLNGLGIDADHIMYPKGYRDKRVTKASRKYHRSGLGSQQQINKLPLDTYDLKRITLDTNDIVFLKAKVDEAILEKGWVIFYGHSGIWEEARFAMFQELIQYVKSLNVPIVTVSQALNVLENKLDVGDIELGNGFKVGSDGSLSATNIPYHYAPAVADLQNKPITFYRPYKITVMAFNSSAQSGIIGYKNVPMSAGSGTLVTNRLFPLDDTFSSQMFYGYNGEIYKRTWNQSTLLWNDWKDISIVVELRGVTGASLVTAFPHKKITISTFLGADNSGIPLSNGIGTLTTNRMGEDAIMHFQTFKGYLSDTIHVRRWIPASNAWGAWTGLIKNVASSVLLGDVPANSYKTVVHPVTGVKAGVIQAQPLGHLTDGISIESIVAGVDTVSIKVYNRTAGTISLGTRSFYFTQE